MPNGIILIKETEHHIIDKNNFEAFRNIVSSMFCANNLRKGSLQFKPGGPQARAIVDKIMKGKQRIAELRRQKDGEQEVSILYQYVSVLAVGLHKDINMLMEYSIYQLFDEFRRFKAYYNYDLWFDMKIAGAKDLKDVENWMGQLSSDT